MNMPRKIRERENGLNENGKSDRVRMKYEKVLGNVRNDEYVNKHAGLKFLYLCNFLSLHPRIKLLNSKYGERTA